MKYRSFSDLAAEVPDGIVCSGIANKELVQDMVRFAFMKATDASSPIISMSTRIDAAYDAVVMFASALFTSNGFYASTAPQDDHVLFEGMAYLLQLPESGWTGVLKLSRWPLRKYTEGRNVSSEFLADVLSSVRLVIEHINRWLQGLDAKISHLA